MPTTPSPTVPPALDEAGHALRQVLLRLDHYARQQVQRLDPAARYAPAVMSHVSDLQALLTAVEQYEQAALASLALPPVNVGELTPAQLLAYREADPVYRLGWVRGHQVGVAQGQRTVEPAVRRYAEHATLPTPTAPPPADYEALVHRVRTFLAQLTQRHGAGPLARPYYAPLPPNPLPCPSPMASASTPAAAHPHRPKPTRLPRCCASTSRPGHAWSTPTTTACPKGKPATCPN